MNLPELFTRGAARSRSNRVPAVNLCFAPGSAVSGIRLHTAVSRERVRQVELRAFEKVRRRVSRCGRSSNGRAGSRGQTDSVAPSGVNRGVEACRMRRKSHNPGAGAFVALVTLTVLILPASSLLRIDLHQFGFFPSRLSP